MLHYRKNRQRYDKYRQEDDSSVCPFCHPEQLAGVREESDLMRIVVNRVSYDVFEGVKVGDHLMLTPKQHRASLGELTDAEKLEYLSLLAKYESAGYSVYSRAVKSIMRSVDHLHTHLLKLEGKPIQAMIYLKRPYFMIHD